MVDSHLDTVLVYQNIKVQGSDYQLTCVYVHPALSLRDCLVSLDTICCKKNT